MANKKMHHLTLGNDVFEIVDKVARSGNYITATTAAEMTETSAIYVYTGTETGYNAGHLYYWDGTAFVDGGEYNGANAELDTTLSVSGKAADAKAVGDVIGEVKDNIDNLVEINGIANNVFRLSTSIGNTTTNGITITVLDDKSIKLNGTASEAFNINVGYKSYAVKAGKTTHFMIKAAGTITEGGIHAYCGWFNISNAASNGSRINNLNTFVDVSYSSDAALSRDYINIHNGATFADAVLTFINTYDLPINETVNDVKETANQALETANQALQTDIVGYPNINLGWEIGSISNTTGLNQNGATRLRTRKFLVGKGSSIKTNANIGAYIFVYGEDGEYNSSDYATLGANAEYTFLTDAKVRVTIRKNDYSAFEENEIETYASYLIIKRRTAQTFFEHDYVTQEEFDAAFDGDINIPTYFNDILTSAIEDARDNIMECGIDGDSFFFLSDLHWENNSRHSGALISKANNKLNVSKIICGGDIINGSTKATAIDNMADAINNYKNIAPFYCLLGNHDLNGIGTTTDDQFTRDGVYALINKESDFNMVYGEPCYYYFDNPTTKTRYICLDTGTSGDLGQDQNTWLTNVLNNTESGWHILIFAHIIYTASSWQAGLQPSDLFMTSYFTALSAQLDSFNSDNMDKKIEAIFGGHVHIDANFETTGSIPIVLIDTDSRGTYSSSGGAVGTVNEHCFDIVTINYSTKTIKCVRVGRGTDRTITY